MTEPTITQADRDLAEAVAKRPWNSWHLIAAHREAAVAELRVALEGIAEFGKRHPGHGFSCATLAEQALSKETLLAKATWFRRCPNTGEYSGEYCSVRPYDDSNMVPMISVDAALSALALAISRASGAGE